MRPSGLEACWDEISPARDDAEAEIQHRVRRHRAEPRLRAQEDLVDDLLEEEIVQRIRQGEQPVGVHLMRGFRVRRDARPLEVEQPSGCPRLALGGSDPRGARHRDDERTSVPGRAVCGKPVPGELNRCVDVGLAGLSLRDEGRVLEQPPFADLVDGGELVSSAQALELGVMPDERGVLKLWEVVLEKLMISEDHPRPGDVEGGLPGEADFIQLRDETKERAYREPLAHSETGGGVGMGGGEEGVPFVPRDSVSPEIQAC